MPMYEIQIDELGTRTRIFRVLADDKESAEERVWEENIAPQTNHFKAYDGDTYVKKLDDCDCDICQRRGPWMCILEDDEEESYFD